LAATALPSRTPNSSTDQPDRDRTAAFLAYIAIHAFVFTFQMAGPLSVRLRRDTGDAGAHYSPRARTRNPD